MDYGQAFWDRRVPPVKLEPFLSSRVTDAAETAVEQGVATKIARVVPSVQARRSQDDFLSLAILANYLWQGDLKSLWLLRTVSRGCRQAASERICILLGLATGPVADGLSEVQGVIWELREVLVRSLLFQRFARLNMRHLSSASMSLRTEHDAAGLDGIGCPINFSPLADPDEEELSARSRKALPAIPVEAIEGAARGCATLRGAATVAVRAAGGWPWIQAVRHYEDAAVVLAAVRQDGMVLQHAPAFQGDVAMVTAAVRENGAALQVNPQPSTLNHKP